MSVSKTQKNECMQESPVDFLLVVLLKQLGVSTLFVSGILVSRCSKCWEVGNLC